METFVEDPTVKVEGLIDTVTVVGVKLIELHCCTRFVTSTEPRPDAAS